MPCAVETFKWNAKTNRRACSVVWGHPIGTDGFSRDRAGYEELTELVTAEIFKLWRLAGEAVANGFPRELSDGAKRFRPSSSRSSRTAVRRARAEDDVGELGRADGVE